MIGKKIFDDKVLQEALDILDKELIADYNIVTASPEYRKNLALSVFYKFVLKIAPHGVKINPRYSSGAYLLNRDISSGLQECETLREEWPLRKNVPKFEADIQCTGEAQYINDMPKQENELYGAFVLSTFAQGKIISLDPTDALNLPGVTNFFSAKDIPGVNNFMPIRKSFGFNYNKEEIICSGDVLYHGQPIGIILAETFALANYAASLVKVDYEVSKDPIYPTLKDVYESKAKERLFDQPEYYVKATEYGNNIKKKITGHFEIPSTQYHFHMETQQCICIPSEEGMDVYSSTQWVDNVQVAISEMLKVPANR